jgi:hypothetical protein
MRLKRASTSMGRPLASDRATPAFNFNPPSPPSYQNARFSPDQLGQVLIMLGRRSKILATLKGLPGSQYSGHVPSVRCGHMPWIVNLNLWGSGEGGVPGGRARRVGGRGRRRGRGRLRAREGC